MSSGTLDEYTPYVFHDDDDAAESWDTMANVYKDKLMELNWHALSLDEQKSKFAEFANIARSDPERYISDLSLYVGAIFYKTVYILVKSKMRGRSPKEIMNAASDVLNMVMLNTRTISRYDPAFAPSTYIQSYIQSSISKMLGAKQMDSNDERVLRKEIGKVTAFAKECGNGRAVPPSIMYAIFEAQMMPNISYTKVKQIIRATAEYNVSDISEIPDSSESYEALESNILCANALEYIKKVYGSKSLEDLQFLREREESCKNVYADASRTDSQRIDNGLVLRRKLRNDTTLMSILNAEYLMERHERAVELKLKNGLIPKEQFDDIVNCDILDEDVDKDLI